MWIALDILGFWIALSIVTTILWSIWRCGWKPFWHEVRECFAPSNVSEHGDLSEGR